MCRQYQALYSLDVLHKERKLNFYFDEKDNKIKKIPKFIYKMGHLM